MQTVLLIRNTAPDNYGGAETYQLLLASQLKSHQFRPVIVTSSRKLYQTANKQGIDAVLAPYAKHQNWSGLRNFLLLAYFIWQKQLTRYYEKLFLAENPSVINIQSRDDWLAATRAAKKLGIKVFWTDHMDFRSWALWHIDKKFKNPIGKQIVKTAHLADKIIFISRYEYDWFTSFPQTKLLKNLTVIKNGTIDQLKNYKSITPVKNSFCYLGRIVEYKGISELIAAFKKVSAKYPDATLNIFGSGDLKKYQKLAGATPHIIFHGYAENPIKALAKNEAFVLPSYREGLSLSLLDAAMMQKTIIVTDVGAASEVIENKKSGLLVHPQSADALADAMLKVLADRPLAATMAKNARIHYEQEFDFSQTFTQKMLSLYKETRRV